MLKLRISTEEDKATLPWFDYSALTAINTCPRWGLIHSVWGRRFTSNDRAMPLEAGKAMHDMFAAVRMFELMDKYAHCGPLGATYPIPDFIDAHGRKLFKSQLFPDRWNEALQIFDQQDDYDTRMMRFGLNILETSGFHDNPDDRRRTQTNLETAAIGYIDRYPKQRYIPYADAASGFVGVEVGFDIVLPTNPPVRFVGKVDGLSYDLMQPTETLLVQENKTGARIDQVWANAFVVGHQVTGYCAALSTVLQRPILAGTIWGTQIPTPKSSAFGDGNAREPAYRNERQIKEWIDWVQHTVDIAMPFMDYGVGDEKIAAQHHPTDAPMYTHSCNRYFRSCSLIPLCAEEPDMRKHIFDKEMVMERWNPLAEGED